MPLFSPFKSTLLCWVLLVHSCGQKVPASGTDSPINIKDSTAQITVGANRIPAYLGLLRNKRVGIVANQTSVIFKSQTPYTVSYVHLVDSLLTHRIDIRKVFAPEHGFRGTADAGEKLQMERTNAQEFPSSHFMVRIENLHKNTWLIWMLSYLISRM